MTTLTARFDGHVLVPEQPIALPQGKVLKIYVEEEMPPATKEKPLGDLAEWAMTLPIDPDSPTDGASGNDTPGKRPLQELAQALEGLPFDPNSPTDGAAQHDHYLYGTPKRS